MGLLNRDTTLEIKRIRQIANVLFKHGLAHAVEKMDLKSYLSFHKKIQKQEFIKPITSLPVRLREVFNSLGGTFVKLGQMMSLRHDLVPKEYCDEFEKLQDNVAPLSFITIRRVVERELGAPIGHFFKEFSKEPIASASVGQVHKAKLRNGQIVAVKVQRPGIEETFKSDIKILYHIVNLINKYYPQTRDYNLKLMIEEFEVYTKKEMDYMLEARNIDIFYKNFKDSETVIIPKVHWDLTKKRILVMDFIKGIKISNVKDFKDLASSKTKTIDNLLNCVMDQIFDYRVFHGDPHPGNILLVNKNKIALLDFGIVGRLLPEMIEEFENILIGLLQQDLDSIVKAYVSLGISEKADFDAKEFKQDLMEKFGEYYGAELQQIDFARFFANSFEMARKYKIYLPLNFTLLAKTLMTLQGYCAEYAPHFNLAEYIEPRVKEMMEERIKPKNVLLSFMKTANNLKNFVQTFPTELSNMMRTITKGAHVNVDVQHNHVTDLALEVDRSSNRITFGVIIAALIIAVAIIIQANVPPIIKGMPLLAYVGFFFIGWLTFLLTVSILRERRMKKGGEL
ncbi:MAG: AarF/ABC1/UbiB kinase family protein [Nanoarchaeota archaeon]|nr:AarF/ABC1/UbiB kinase family protein [Nanoarchaeota archaeon]MBU4242524.1 AarF/ABC1/UbiB kinase family protein [Nanoarchaeota archaeon]MBU4352104.1 AarF/ABC1/UbiB kinase family protein [Nanoarchaeota archaeon]MBU4455928.1 AarF/ABC1/UbiB kinase family protein [Nanoarchaeota archaeon]MCG2719432.1 AarF/ABC1/UbiB kinase family protein [Nanoarchaeota archaeon]